MVQLKIWFEAIEVHLRCRFWGYDVSPPRGDVHHRHSRHVERLLRRIYYQIRPVIPRHFQISLRRKFIQQKLRTVQHIWPIDPQAAQPPLNWQGWPAGRKFALVLTHDVESQKGLAKCEDLMRLEMERGFRSSFNFVPEDYQVSAELRHKLIANGFEVGVHGLKHDGKLYRSKRLFTAQAQEINRYLRAWHAVGFRSPSMHHNLEWLGALDIAYDTSTFDTDPFEPQADGMGTIFPFWVSSTPSLKGYIELPYTLPQDFTLFVLMQEKNIRIWQRKIDWIANNGGMALLNVHPDYMNFTGGKPGLEEFPAEFYKEFLHYVKTQYEGQYWHVLPKEISHFWTSFICNKDDLKRTWV